MATKKGGNKKATISQPKVKKPAPAKATEKPVQKMSEETASEQPVSNPEFDKKVAAIREKHPQITDADITRYAGETDESILRRMAEKAGVPYEELIG